METAEEIAKAFRIPEIASNWEEVITRPDLDVIWIGTTPHLHAPISTSALEAGKHVFCQARMAMNLAEAREMLEVSQAHPKQIAMLCPPPNGMKHGKYFLKLLKENYIGQLTLPGLTRLRQLIGDNGANSVVTIS
jgi:predicted dehydrogenase